MREAMANAVVGDDGYGEDPTINAVEARYAMLTGKEAAVFVPTGVMANQIAMRIHTRPGDVVLAGRTQHVVMFERGATARNASVQFTLVDDDHGYLSPDDIAYWRDTEADHQVGVQAVVIENTHMASGGTPWTLPQLAAVSAAAAGLPIHMDGARLFNAAIATGIPASDIAAHATTVMTCLSKGLSAPLGSLLAGPASLMASARIERKRLGGSMRQAGIAAAAGLLALDTMIERLADDHRRARVLAEAVARRLPTFDPSLVRTNIVAITIPRARDVEAALASHGVLAGTVAPNRLRLVTHAGISDDDIAFAVSALDKVLH
jgi:threonine aldolase